jgi:hypothetical protein
MGNSATLDPRIGRAFHVRNPAQQTSCRAPGTELLPSQYVSEKRRKIGERGTVWNVARHSRFRPTDNLLFSLSHGENDDSNSGCVVPNSANYVNAIRKCRIEKDDVGLSVGYDRERLLGIVRKR